MSCGKNLFDNITSSVSLCISISGSPGSLGFKLHNKGYEILGLDYIYLPLKASNPSVAVDAIRNFGIKGCSVSMPFKETVIEFLDEMDINAQKVGAVNTILNSDNKLIGYNTDFSSASKVAGIIKQKDASRILILGAGGFARAFLVAIQSLTNVELYYSARTRKDFFDNWATFIPWEKRNIGKFDAIINATPLGMQGEIPYQLVNSSETKLVVDAVSNPNLTKFVESAEKLQIKSITGAELAFEQFLQQFLIYTGKEIDRDKILNYYLNLTGTNFV